MIIRQDFRKMKKIIFIALSLFLTFSCHAISLFPHFTDVAGDYEEGTAPKFSELKIPTTCWRVNPHFFNTIAGADEFLADTLPFSSYQIVKDTKTLEDGTKIITYFAPSEDGVFGKDETLTGKGSYLFLIQTPDEPLYVGIFEGSYDGEP